MPTPPMANESGYLGPFVIIVIMMTVIGFITSIGQQFQTPVQSTYLYSTGAWTNSFTTLLILTFFLSYLVLEPTSARLVGRHGYKVTITKGLLLLAGGILLFILSALLFMRTSLWFTLSETVQLPVGHFIFLLGSFVCGAGITLMQLSVNPRLIACAVLDIFVVQWQDVESIGNSTMTMLAPLFISVVIFDGMADLKDIQIREIVLPITALVVIVLVFSHVVRRLHASHIEDTTSGEDVQMSSKMVWHIPYVRLGCIALFYYVGVEVCVGVSIILYGKDDLGLNYNAVTPYATLYRDAMLVDRFVSSFLSHVTNRELLWVTTPFSAVLILIAVVTNQPYWFIIVGLYHSVIQGTIHSLTLKGLGSLAVRVSGVLLARLIGRALLPFPQSVLANLLEGYHHIRLLAARGELYTFYYALLDSRPKG